MKELNTEKKKEQLNKYKENVPLHHIHIIIQVSNILTHSFDTLCFIVLLLVRDI